MFATGRLVQGEFRPGGVGMEWCDADVLRALRRRSMAKLRQEVEPAPPQALARFLPAWQGVGVHAGRGIDALLRTIEQLAGAAVPASMLEPVVLAGRVAGYAPSMLDELTSTGDVVWVGQGALPGNDGWVSLHLADTAPLLLPDLDDGSALTPVHRALLDALDGGGALFFRALSERVGSTDDPALAGALWDLVWSGRVTNDTLAPLRALTGGRTWPYPCHADHANPPAGSTGHAGTQRPARRCRTLVPGGGARPRPDAPGPCERRSAARPVRHRDPRYRRRRAHPGRLRRCLPGAESVRGDRPLSPGLLRRRPRRRPVRPARCRRPDARAGRSAPR